MILITGASGQLASQVIAISESKNLPIITASRSVKSARRMDFDDPSTLDFSDIETIFLTSAGYAEDDVVINRHGNVIAAAQKQGVRQIVYTSLSAASDHLGFALAHRWTEHALRQSNIAWTILRNGLYAELIGALAMPENGIITAPFGSGRISAVPRADLATAAANVLKNPQAHAGRSYELSGASAFTIGDITHQLDLTYAPISMEKQREELSKQPLLPYQPPMLMSFYSAAAAGFLETQKTDLLALVPEPSSALKCAVSVIKNAKPSSS